MLTIIHILAFRRLELVSKVLSIGVQSLTCAKYGVFLCHDTLRRFSNFVCKDISSLIYGNLSALCRRLISSAVSKDIRKFICGKCVVLWKRREDRHSDALRRYSNAVSGGILRSIFARYNILWGRRDKRRPSSVKILCGLFIDTSSFFDNMA